MPDRLPRDPPPRTAPGAVPATGRIRMRAPGSRYAATDDRSAAPRGDRSARLHTLRAEEDVVAQAYASKDAKVALHRKRSICVREQIAAVVGGLR